MAEGVTTGREQRYYTALGRASDYLLRCKDCQRLQLLPALQQRGCCVCGNKRVTEITTLSMWEWLKIRLGIIEFQYRREFLKEFSVRG